MTLDAHFVLSDYLIDRRLLPNRGTPLRSVKRYRAQQRGDVLTLLRSQVNQMGVSFDPTRRYDVTVQVGWPRELASGPRRTDRRYLGIPDGDAINTACKGLFDALADAIGVDDRMFDVQAPRQVNDPDDRGWVAISVMAKGGEG